MPDTRKPSALRSPKAQKTETKVEAEASKVDVSVTKSETEDEAAEPKAPPVYTATWTKPRSGV